MSDNASLEANKGQTKTAPKSKVEAKDTNKIVSTSTLSGSRSNRVIRNAKDVASNSQKNEEVKRTTADPQPTNMPYRVGKNSSEVTNLPYNGGKPELTNLPYKPEKSSVSNTPFADNNRLLASAVNNTPSNRMSVLAAKDKLTKEEKKEVKQAYKELKKYGIQQDTYNQREKLQKAIDSGELDAQYVRDVQNAYFNTSAEGAATSTIAGFGKSFLADPVLDVAAGVETLRGKNNNWTNARTEANETYNDVVSGNKGAAKAGELTGTLTKYLALNGIISGAFAPAGTAGLGMSVADNVAGEMLADNAADIALMTIPKLAGAYADGARGSDLVKVAADETVSNALGNIGMNFAGEALGATARGLSKFKNWRSAKNVDVADALKNIEGEQSQIDDITKSMLDNSENITLNNVQEISKPVVEETPKNIQRVAKPKTNDVTYGKIRKQLDDVFDNAEFASEAEKNEFVKFTNNMEEAYNRALASDNEADFFKNIDEFAQNYEQANKLYQGSSSNVPFETGAADAKQAFKEQTKGWTIKLTDDMRTEMGLMDRTIPSLNSEINKKLGRAKGNIHFSTTSGSPIDEIPELKQLIDPANESNGSNADLVNMLMNKIDEVSGQNVKTAKTSNEGVDLLSEDIFDDIMKNADDKFYGKEYEIAEDIGLENTTKDVDDILASTEEEFAPPEFNTNFTEEYGGRFGTPKQSTRKTSGLYSNTLQREVDPETFARTYDRNAFQYDSTSNAELAERAAQIIDLNGFDNEVERLYNLENFTAQDVATAGMVHDYLLKNGYEEEAFDFARQIRPRMSTSTAQALQAHRMWALSTPEGALNETLMKLDNAIDKKHMTGGYSDAVNNVTDAVKDAVENGDIDGLTKIFDDTLGDYSSKSGKWRKSVRDKEIAGKQEVLDIINSAKNTKKSPAELAEECARVVANKMGGNTLSRSQEHEVLGLLKKMSNFEPNSREYKEIQAQAMSIVQNAMPTTVGSKIKNILYSNMLGNFRTAITRNFGGNAFANTLEGIQKPIRVGLDKALSAKTGVRNYIYDKEITQEGIKGFGKGIADQAADIKAGIQTTRSGENTLNDALNEVTKAYKYNGNKVHDMFAKAANKYVDTVRDVMKFGDRPFYEGQYAAAKKELEKIVERYGDDAIQRAGAPEGVKTEELIEFWAHERALEACYQNGSLTSSGMTKLKQGLGEMSKDWLGFDIMSQTTSPFVQVPGNMISRGVQYTPLGVLGNTARTVSELATNNFNQKRFVDETSRNLVGLGLTGGAVAAANKGLTTGAYSDDPDKKNAQRNAGELEYALNILGTQIDMSDIPVVGGKIQGAAQMYDTLKQNMGVDDKTLVDMIISNYENGTLSEALSAGIKGDIEAQVGTSAMQGYNRLFGGNSSYTTTDSIMDNISDTIKSAKTQLVPSLLRQAAAFSDTNKRDLGEYGSDEYYNNLVKNSIPGLRQTMPEKIDAQGQPILQNQGRTGLTKALENFILPYTISQPQYSDISSEANRLSESLGSDADVAYTPSFARKDAKTLLGDDYSEEAYYNLRKEYGDTITELNNALINSEEYKNASDSVKATAMENMNKAAKAITQSKHGKDVSNSVAAAYENSLDDAVAKAMETAKSSVSGSELKGEGYTANQVTKAMYEAGDQEGLDKYAEAEEIAKSMGIKSITESQYKLYKSKGRVSLMQELDYERKAKEYGTTNTEDFRKAYQSGTVEKYVAAKNAIESISDGVDEYGEPKTLSYTEKRASIYSDKGVDGVRQYEQFNTDYDNLKKQNDKAKFYDVVKNSNLSDSDKGYYISQKSSAEEGSKLGNIISKAKSSGDYTDVYNYYMYMEKADGYGNGKHSTKNGSLAVKDELVPYLKKTNLSNKRKNEIVSWYQNSTSTTRYF